MNPILNILFVDDDASLRANLLEVFNDDVIEGHTLVVSEAADFEKGKSLIANNDYDLVVLDLYKGEPKEENEKLGLDVLKAIQAVAFIPVIFYSGLTKDLVGFESEIVGVVNKGSGGIEQLRIEIGRIIKSNIGLIKRKVYDHVKITLRDYFWKTVHDQKNIIEPVKDDISIGYLLLRRLAHSLSKENIKALLGDEKIRKDKSHPMEFYLFPSGDDEYEAGEILKKDQIYYVILTPSCDFITEGSRSRKVGHVLLAVATKLADSEPYKKYQSNKEKYRQTLSDLIESRKGDRYFFLPGTPFIDNLVLDFQSKTMVVYENLKDYERIAKLDMPFAQSMISSFSRYYNRIGFPDIDAEYVINKL
jgi:CheY-like chemotaxis protein